MRTIDVIILVMGIISTIGFAGIVDIIILSMQIIELERCSIWDSYKLDYVNEDGITWEEAIDFGRVSKFICG